jgi:membrane protein YdbS with pleckstrin-like domain
MSYPGHRLADDEDLVLETRPHWVVLVPPIFVFVVAILGGSIVYGLVPGGFLQDALRVLVLVVSFALMLWFAVRPALRWLTTRLRVTSDRLLWRSGLRTGREIPLERLTDVTVAQSLFERLFGLGDVTVRAAGEAARLTMPDLPRPGQVLDAINRQVEAHGARYRGGYGGAAYAQPADDDAGPATLEREAVRPPAADGRSVVDQLHYLADLRDRGDISHEEFRRIKDDLLKQL